MRFLIFGDPHWSTTSSIVVSRGQKYSRRLHMLIDSLNWITETAKAQHCDKVICAGDFFDKPFCTDEEITALKDVKWDKSLEYYFLVGNHESSVNGLRFSSTKQLQGKNMHVISTPTQLAFENFDLCFLPYIVETDRKPLADYFSKWQENKPRIMISHNDISGISYAGFVSNMGFSIDEIRQNCTLFLNGHLHNSELVANSVLNVGSLSAHNFTNDSSRYSYGAWVVDTDKAHISFSQNPHAFNFYKLHVTSLDQLSLLSGLRDNAVISVTCTQELLPMLRQHVSLKQNIIESRFVTVRGEQHKAASAQEAQHLALSVDHFKRFQQECISRFGASDVLLKQLAELCKQ